MKSGLGDIDPDLAKDAGVNGLGALLGIPGPFIFGSPLHFSSRVGPAAVESKVDAVVFGVGGESTNPAVVTAGSVEMDGIGEDGHLSALVRKVLSFDEFVSMRATGVGENFEVGSTRGRAGVIRVAVRLDIGCVFGGDDVPGPDIRLVLGNEMFGFNCHDSVFFLKDKFRSERLGGSK